MTKKIAKVAPTLYILFYLFVFISLSYMMLCGVPQSNLGLIIVPMIFGFLFLFGLAVSRTYFTKISTTESFYTSTKSFTAGFFIWFVLVNLRHISSFFDVFRFPTQATLATIQEQIPPFWGFVNTVFMAPIVEELFWGIAIPIALFNIMDSLSDTITLFKNMIVQFVVVLAVAGYTFAVFHTSTTQIGFFIAAVIFRSVMVFLLHADRKFDIIPGFIVTFAFIIGAHMANNLAVYGLTNAYSILISSVYGWITMVFFALIFATGIRGFFYGNGK